MGSRDLIALQSGVKPLEGAWSQGTSVGSGLLGLREDQGVLEVNTASVVRQV